MDRREYDIKLQVNGISIRKLVIDPHYLVNHPDITDEIIIKLVHEIDGGSYTPDNEDNDGFKYFVNDHLSLDNRTYKLIWLLKEGEIFIGVVNCYRRD